MKNNLLFLILSGALLALSVITVCLAPIINKANGNNNYFQYWNIANCQLADDEYKHDKANDVYNPETTGDDHVKIREKIVKRRIEECKRHKVMYSLEYVAFIVDIVLGFICFVLGLMHFLESGNQFEKTSGMIGLVSGIIAAVITIVYVAFSALIFNNEPIVGSEILYPNKAYAHWNGNKYIYDYDEDKSIDEDYDLKYIKYKDLGKIQYNYDSEFYQMTIDSTNENEYKNCQVPKTTFGSYDRSTQKIYLTDQKCEYLWDTSVDNDSTDNKFLYDRWITTIIFGVLITACGLCLGVFGLLLFKGKSDWASSPTEMPVNVVNNQ